ALRNVEHALAVNTDFRLGRAGARNVENEAPAGRPLAKLVRAAETGVDDEAAAFRADLGAGAARQRDRQREYKRNAESQKLSHEFLPLLRLCEVCPLKPVADADRPLAPGFRCES